MIAYHTSHILPPVGEEAKRVYDDATALLKRIQEDGSLRCQAVIGFWRANSRQDDIVLYHPESDTEMCTLHGIRQQVSKIFSGDIHEGQSTSAKL